jgi:hypothetical protein
MHFYITYMVSLVYFQLRWSEADQLVQYILKVRCYIFSLLYVEI